jgi:D-threo-aldose 1-dehydrogenase
VRLKPFNPFPNSAATTHLGLGTTSMMGLPSTKERLALLESAFELGIRHFDTAPLYGYGEAERVLGEFLRGRRDQVTITTKYGIKPPVIMKTRWMNLFARRVLRLLPFLHNAASRQAQSLSKRSVFTAAEARSSLDQSLLALGTDYVDLFLLHEPMFEDASSEEIHGFLAEEKQRGRVRAFGCGGSHAVIEVIASAKLPTSQWLQFEDHVLSRRIEGIQSGDEQCITFGSFKALPELTDWLKSVPGRCDVWERELGCDCRSQDTLAALLQAASHARNPDGIVLFSTRRTDRIAAAVKTASGNEFSGEQLRKFDELTKSIRSGLTDF